MDDELQRLRRRTELAIARARVTEAEERHRERLLSEDDIEELTGRTAVLLDDRLANQRPPDSLEIRTPAGFTLVGRLWVVIVAAVVIAALVAALKMIRPH